MASFKDIIIGTAGIPATCTITSDESEFTDATLFEIQIEFSKSVTGFVVGDITINNATLSNFAGSGTSYTADVTPDLAGDITISVAADVTNEGNTASNTVTVTDNSGLLLNTYNNATVAVGLVRLDKNYAGSCIRVRRSSDNAVQDIGFSGDSLDTSALTSFLGANHGYVTTWYDQSGNGNDLTETKTSLLPIIATSGTIETSGGLPAIKQSGNKRLKVSKLSGATMSATSTVFGVAKNTANKRIFLSAEISAVDGYVGAAESGRGDPSYAVAGTPTTYVNNSAIGSTMGNLYTATNLSQSILAFENCDLSAWSHYVTDYFHSSYEGYDFIQALVIFTDDKSADRSDICDYFNDIYSCY